MSSCLSTISCRYYPSSIVLPWSFVRDLLITLMRIYIWALYSFPLIYSCTHTTLIWLLSLTVLFQHYVGYFGSSASPYKLYYQFVESESCPVVSDSLWPHELCSPWNSPGQNTGVGSLSLLQGIFPPRNWTWVSWIAGRFFTNWAIRETLSLLRSTKQLAGILTEASCLLRLKIFPHNVSAR